MAKYKVGDKFYVAPCGRYGQKGNVVVTKVGRKYAQLEFDKPKEHEGVIIKLNMETNDVISSPFNYIVGTFYKTKEDYELDNKKKNLPTKYIAYCRILTGIKSSLKFQ